MHTKDYEERFELASRYMAMMLSNPRITESMEDMIHPNRFNMSQPSINHFVDLSFKIATEMKKNKFRDYDKEQT
jgi:hypothetical protein